MHWRRKWQPTPVFLPGESQGRGSLVSCHLWGCTESNTTEVTFLTPIKEQVFTKLCLSFFTVYVQFLNCMIFIHCLSFTQYWTLVLIRMHFFLTRSSQGLYWVFHKGTISLQYLKAQKFLLELTADNVCQVFLKINAHFRKHFQAFHS